MSDLVSMDNSKVISELLVRLQGLAHRITVLERDNLLLRRGNAVLRERLSKYENPKNSRNSSIPPSKDENRPKKNQSLRRPSGKKVGGQPGHKGSTLEMVAAPDNIIDLVPGHCNTCGVSLCGEPAIREGSRQIVDIPPIKAVWTEYRTFAEQCGCGGRTVADFPKGVDTPVSYGENIEGLVGYFHARQYLPFKRMQEVFNDVMGIDISEGGIHRLLNRFADRTTPLYRMIKQRVANAKVVGTDETGVKVNGGKHWLWVWQTSLLTYIAHSDNRGKATIEAHFPNGFPNSTLVRDGWRPQTGTIAEHHQTCLPHLLRHLNYLNEKYQGPSWGVQLKKLLYHAMQVGGKGHGKDQGYNLPRAEIVQGLGDLLDRPPDKEHKELHTFYKRICRERQHLFTFLFIEDVPPDNNASERAIRNVKVKQKISGQFKTERAARNFAKIRSVIDTTIKNGMNVLDALALIAKLQPQIVD